MSDRPDSTDTPSDKSVPETESWVNALPNSGLLLLIHEYPQAYFPIPDIDETLLPFLFKYTLIAPSETPRSNSSDEDRKIP
jgi:hypothetical protein